MTTRILPIKGAEVESTPKGFIVKVCASGRTEDHWRMLAQGRRLVDYDYSLAYKFRTQLSAEKAARHVLISQVIEVDE